MKDNTEDIKPIKEDVAVIKIDTNEMKGTVGEIKKDTGAIRTKIEECLTCGQKKTVVIAPPAVIPTPAVVFSAPVLPSCTSTCSAEGQTRCTPGCLTGDQRDVCVRSGNCLVWQRQDCTGGQYCDSGTCRTRAVVTRRCYNGDVWTYTNGNRQNLSEDCGDSHYSSGQIYRCSGDRREYQERVETRCVEPVTGQAQCKSESYWLLDEDCSNGCSNNRCKQEEKRCESEHEKKCYGGDVYWYDSCGDRGNRYDSCGSNETCSDGRCVEQEHEEECSSGCCSGNCGGQEQTTTVIVVINNPPNPPVVPEAPQPVIAPPAPPSPPIVIGCTQNCTPSQVEGSSANPVYNPPALPAVPTVTGCTQNCTPSQVEGNYSTVPVSAPPPPPAPSAPVTTGSNTLWSPP